MIYSIKIPDVQHRASNCSLYMYLSISYVHAYTLLPNPLLLITPQTQNKHLHIRSQPTKPTQLQWSITASLESFTHALFPSHIKVPPIMLHNDTSKATSKEWCVAIDCQHLSIGNSWVIKVGGEWVWESGGSGNIDGFLGLAHIFCIFECILHARLQLFRFFSLNGLLYSTRRPIPSHPF